VVQETDVKRQASGGYPVCLCCVISSQTVGALGYLAFTPLARVDMEPGLPAIKDAVMAESGNPRVVAISPFAGR
jgi:hypothetical protein